MGKNTKFIKITDITPLLNIVTKKSATKKYPCSLVDYRSKILARSKVKHNTNLQTIGKLTPVCLCILHRIDPILFKNPQMPVFLLTFTLGIPQKFAYLEKMSLITVKSENNWSSLTNAIYCSWEACWLLWSFLRYKKTIYPRQPIQRK